MAASYSCRVAIGSVGVDAQPAIKKTVMIIARMPPPVESGTMIDAAALRNRSCLPNLAHFEAPVCPENHDRPKASSKWLKSLVPLR